jgi:hypothetical protein
MNARGDNMLSNMRRAAESQTKVSPPSLPAPRVRVRQTKGGQALEAILDGPADLNDFRAAFLAAFGTIDEGVAQALFNQLVNALHADPGKAVDSANANLALALMHEIAPGDVVEAMLATQMLVAHVAAMEASRRALHVEQTPGGRQAYLGLARKLMTLFTAQMDALNRHRGKATVQKVVVERVYVAPGAQAVVGAVSSRGRGDG